MSSTVTARSRRILKPLFHAFLAVGLFSTLGLALRADDGKITSVSARTSEDYVRIRLPDGSFATETYAFGRGGLWKGSQEDPTIDRFDFVALARTVAAPLGEQHYVSATEPERTKLLIMVYWGTTTGPADNPGLFIGQKRLAYLQTVRNAKMLGYADDLSKTSQFARSPLDWKTKDLWLDVGDNRYFVVLMAYDFQLMWKQKKHKLLWETRFSIQEHRNDFGESLPAMAEYASRYFGQNSQGVIRRRFPQGSVEVGEPVFKSYEPDKK